MPDIPEGYHRRLDGAMGKFEKPKTCPACRRKVRIVYGYEKNWPRFPDISVCGECMVKKEKQGVQ